MAPSSPVPHPLARTSVHPSIDSGPAASRRLETQASAPAPAETLASHLDIHPGRKDNPRQNRPDPIGSAPARPRLARPVSSADDSRRGTNRLRHGLHLQTGSGPAPLHGTSTRSAVLGAQALAEALPHLQHQLKTNQRHSNHPLTHIHSPLNLQQYRRRWRSMLHIHSNMNRPTVILLS